MKDTLNAIEDFKDKQESVWSNAFGYVKVHKTLYIEIITNFRKTLFGQKEHYKNALFLLLLAPIMTVLFLICNSFICGRTRFISKTLCEIFDLLILFCFY